MDLCQYRQAPIQQARVADLIALLPRGEQTALDIGARDGYLSRKLAPLFASVVALDLVAPDVSGPNIAAVRGDVTSLEFPDNAFDCILCAEVLEHIPSRLLDKACAELMRVARRHLLIGVPYREDTRFGRTRCRACGRNNPPYGHVNVFDEKRLRRLFHACAVEKVSFVGTRKERTNFLSSLLMDLGGNPGGTYAQDEPCIYCGAKLLPPGKRGFPRKVAAKLARWAYQVQAPFVAPRPCWIHVLFRKRAGAGPEEVAGAAPPRGLRCGPEIP